MEGIKIDSVAFVWLLPLDQPSKRYYFCPFVGIPNSPIVAYVIIYGFKVNEKVMQRMAIYKQPHLVCYYFAWSVLGIPDLSR